MHTNPAKAPNNLILHYINRRRQTYTHQRPMDGEKNINEAKNVSTHFTLASIQEEKPFDWTYFYEKFYFCSIRLKFSSAKFPSNHYKHVQLQIFVRIFPLSVFLLRGEKKEKGAWRLQKHWSFFLKYFLSIFILWKFMTKKKFRQCFTDNTSINSHMKEL